MPPKKDPKSEKGQQKALEKQKAKIVEDKTFGLKNKNKSKQVQKYIKSVQQAAQGQYSISPQVLLDKENQKKEEKKKKLQQEALLASLFKGTQNVAKINASDAQKTDPTSIKEGQAIDLYTDQREKKKNDSMEEWDQEKLEDVIRTKHGGSNTTKPTDIVCKYFIDALEKKQYGWFWTCPNGGDNCRYRHCLPPGYVLETKKPQQNDDDEKEIALEELIEAQRAALPYCEDTVTLESFLEWKERREKSRLENLDRERQAGIKTMGAEASLALLSGRDLFTFNPSLFIDDAGAAEENDYEEDENYWTSVMEENRKIVDVANREALSHNRDGGREQSIYAGGICGLENDCSGNRPVEVTKPSVFLNGNVPDIDALSDDDA